MFHAAAITLLHLFSPKTSQFLATIAAKQKLVKLNQIIKINNFSTKLMCQQIVLLCASNKQCFKDFFTTFFLQELCLLIIKIYR